MPVGHDDLGLLLQDEHDRAARGHDREGRIGHVEDEGASHAAECSVRVPCRTSAPANCPGRESHACNLAEGTTGRPGEMPGVANRGRAGRPPAGPARRSSGSASLGNLRVPAPTHRIVVGPVSGNLPSFPP